MLCVRDWELPIEWNTSCMGHKSELMDGCSSATCTESFLYAVCFTMTCTVDQEIFVVEIFS